MSTLILDSTPTSFCDSHLGLKTNFPLFTLFNRSSVSQMVSLLLDSKRTSVLCHMGDFGCGEGGWTPVMKIDGNKVYYIERFTAVIISWVVNGWSSLIDMATKVLCTWEIHFIRIFTLRAQFKNYVLTAVHRDVRITAIL